MTQWGLGGEGLGAGEEKESSQVEKSEKQKKKKNFNFLNFLSKNPIYQEFPAVITKSIPEHTNERQEIKTKT